MQFENLINKQICLLMSNKLFQQECVLYTRDFNMYNIVSYNKKI